MNGRSKFSIIEPVLKVMAGIFRFVPNFLHGWFWDLSNALPNILGLGVRYALSLGKAKHIGKNVYWARNITVKHWQNLVIGDNVSFHENCFIDALGGIEIGSNVSIAHASSLVSFDHMINPELPIKYGSLASGKITIADDVWIAAGVRVLRNTTIGTRVVIAANAVARGDIESGWLYGGLPARQLKSLSEAKKATSLTKAASKNAKSLSEGP